jgi:hypothetical protein
MDFADLAPFLSSSPVTALCLVLWWEMRSISKAVQSMGERIAAIESVIDRIKL